MPNLRDIRNRITAVGKTQKITKAMKMVSAAKFARAQGAIESARPYAEKLGQVLASVAGGVEADAHPLLAPRASVRKLDVVVFTSDRGLCGAYNANVLKFAEKLIATRRPRLDAVSIIAVGKKGADLTRSRQIAPIARSWTGLPTIRPPLAAEIAAYLISRYQSGEADEVILVYSTFESALTQRPGQLRLLPLSPEGSGEAAPYEVEPNAEALLATLVPRAVDFQIFRALLENQAGEHGARMTAMENATNNTQELIRTLTIQGNKARQAAITAELVEIVSGADAL